MRLLNVNNGAGNTINVDKTCTYQLYLMAVKINLMLHV